MLTTVIRKFDQPAYPFDWNITNQSFVIKCVESGGSHFFEFAERHMVDGFLLSPHNDAFLFHEYKHDRPLWIENGDIKETYLRRLHRLLEAYYSDSELLLCRHAIDANPYNDYAKSSWSRLPFRILPDNVCRWSKFISRRPKTRLIIFTNDPTMVSNDRQIYIRYIDDIRGDSWNDAAHAMISSML